MFIFRFESSFRQISQKERSLSFEKVGILFHYYRKVNFLFGELASNSVPPYDPNI